MTTTAQQTQHRARRCPPRVAVTGQFRLVVETIARSLVPAARIFPVPLETCSMNGACDAVLRTKAALVVVVIAEHDTVDVHGLVADLADRGQLVVVVGQLGDAESSAELASAGAFETMTAGGLSEVRALIARMADTPAIPAPRPSASPATADGALTAERRARRNLGRLTPAEARILWRLMHGSSVTEIARTHVVSVETVRSQIRALLTKLEAGSQLAAVALAWRVGWTPTTAAVPAA